MQPGRGIRTTKHSIVERRLVPLGDTVRTCSSPCQCQCRTTGATPQNMVWWSQKDVVSRLRLVRTRPRAGRAPPSAERRIRKEESYFRPDYCQRCRLAGVESPSKPLRWSCVRVQVVYKIARCLLLK